MKSGAFISFSLLSACLYALLTCVIYLLIVVLLSKVKIVMNFAKGLFPELVIDIGAKTFSSAFVINQAVERIFQYMLQFG